MVREDSRSLSNLVVSSDGLFPTEPVVWTSSDDRVATIHPLTGQAKAIGSGSATITASLQRDPNVKAILTVNVVEQRTVVLLKVKPDRPTMQLGDKENFSAEVIMADGQINGNVAWSSSDDTIATVNPTTGSVSALREGRVTIVASYVTDPKYKGLAEVTIVADKTKLMGSPSPTPVVFGPGATPRPPDGSPTSAPPIGSTPIPETPVVAPQASPTSVISQPKSRWLIQQTGTANTLKGVFFLGLKTGYVVGQKGTLLMTKDGGSTWQPIASPILADSDLESIFFSDDMNGWIVGRGGAFKTSDGGATWTKQLTAGELWAVHFVSTTDGFVGGDKTYRTTDGGKTWTLQPISLRNYSMGSAGGTVWAAGDGGIYRFKSDLGWYKARDLHTGWIRGCTISVVSATKVWLLTGQFGGNVSFTDDGGDSWKDARFVGKDGKALSQYAYFNTLAFSGSLDGIVLAGSQAFKTADGGSTWSESAFGAIDAGYSKYISAAHMVDKENLWGVSGTQVLRHAVF